MGSMVNWADPHLEVVDHAGVTILSRHVAGTIPTAVHLIQPPAATEEKFGAWEGASDGGPVQRGLLVGVSGINGRALEGSRLRV